MDDHKANYAFKTERRQLYVEGENELTNKIPASITVRETVKLKNVTFTLAKIKVYIINASINLYRKGII